MRNSVVLLWSARTRMPAPAGKLPDAPKAVTSIGRAWSHTLSGAPSIVGAVEVGNATRVLELYDGGSEGMWLGVGSPASRPLVRRRPRTAAWRPRMVSPSSP